MKNPNSTFNNKLLLAFLLTAALSALSCLNASAQTTVTWQGTTGSNWSSTGSWVGGVVPGAVGTTTNGDTANFTSTGTITVNLDNNYNLSNIAFGTSAGAYTISSSDSSSILLSNGGSISTTGTGSNNETISTGIVLEGNDSFTGNYSSTKYLTISGGVSGTATSGNVDTLSLLGSSVGSGATVDNISGAITDGSGGGKMAVVVGNGSSNGTWSLGSTSNTITGGVTLNSGELIFSGATGSLGTGVLTLNGGTLASNGNNTLTNSGIVVAGNITIGGATSATGRLTINTGISITDGGTHTLTAYNGGAGSIATSMQLAGAVNTGTGTLVWNQQGAGKLEFGTAAATLTGNLEVENGTVFSGTGTAAIGAGGNIQLDANGTLELGDGAGASRSITTGALSGNGTVSDALDPTTGDAGTLIVTEATGVSSTFSGKIIDGSAHVAVTKAGVGTLNLTGTSNTYTGATTVNAGSLNLGGNLSTSAVSVAGAATLGGEGVATSGASEGLLTLSALTLHLGTTSATQSVLSLDFGASTAFSDGFSVTNALTLTGTGTVDLLLTDLTNGSLAPGTYDLLNWGSAVTAPTVSTFSLDPNSSADISAANLTVSGNELEYVVAAVPEPGSGMMALLGLGLLCFVNKARRFRAE